MGGRGGGGGGDWMKIHFHPVVNTCISNCVIICFKKLVTDSTAR